MVVNEMKFFSDMRPSFVISIFIPGVSLAKSGI